MIGPISDALSNVVGDTAANIIAPALEGAGVGALSAAAQGNKPLLGAVTGGVTGGALGAFTPTVADTLGVSPGVAGAIIGGGVNALGSLATHQNPLVGGALGALAGYGYGSTYGGGDSPMTSGTLADGTTLAPASASGGNMLLDENGNPVTDAQGRPLYAATDAQGNIVSSGGGGSSADGGASTGSPLGDQAATVAGNGGGGKGGIGNSSLILGALAALGQMASKPKQQPYSVVPGPQSVTSSPYFNAPLSMPSQGRTALNPGLPTGQQPNYWSYGGPEQTYFSNNSLGSYGFRHGGAPAHEWTTASHGRHVQGPGTSTSDSIPAQLSNGEYVLTARDVARVGGGSNERGARILDHDRNALARMVGEPQFVRRSNGPLGSIQKRDAA
jgi:hypothetical protein